jgi:kelch-like protein 8
LADTTDTVCPRLPGKVANVRTLPGLTLEFAAIIAANLATVEGFDPSSSSWARNFPSMRCARNALATAVLNGRVYAFGGSTEAFGNPACTVESWAVGESRWRAEASMPHQRMRHAAVALGERLYVLGGHDGEKPLDSVSSYDPVSKVREADPKP